jgi:hypothetical protein
MSVRVKVKTKIHVTFIFESLLIWVGVQKNVVSPHCRWWHGQFALPFIFSGLSLGACGGKSCLEPPGRLDRGL